MGLRTVATAVVAAVLVLGGSACGDDDGTSGGDGGGTVTADAIVEELKGLGMGDAMAECMGNAYESAGFTLEEVRDMGSEAPSADTEKFQAFAEEAQACAGTDISAPSGG